MDADLCMASREKELLRHGPPEIFNTDQGCRFTSLGFTQVLKDADVRISMGGKGRWLDNPFDRAAWTHDGERVRVPEGV